MGAASLLIVESWPWSDAAKVIHEYRRCMVLHSPSTTPSEDHQATPSYCPTESPWGELRRGAFGTCTRVAGLYWNLSVAGPAALCGQPLILTVRCYLIST